MIKLADILREHHGEFISAYAHLIHTVHHRAIDKILACHTPACGEIHSQCPDCQHDGVNPLLVDTAFVRPANISLTVTG
jgi:hypothetical protein